MMSESTRDLKFFTLPELKDMLKQKDLNTKGNKNELISRLMNDDTSWPEGGKKASSLTSRSIEAMYNDEVRRDDGEDEARGDFSVELDGEDGEGGVAGRGEDGEGLRRVNEEEERSCQREIELCRREKRLAERELALARREIEYLRQKR